MERPERLEKRDDVERRADVPRAAKRREHVSRAFGHRQDERAAHRRPAALLGARHAFERREQALATFGRRSFAAKERVGIARVGGGSSHLELGDGET